MGFEKKTKFALWVYPQTLRNVEKYYKGDNCKSQSEFIEKAINFYLGYLNEATIKGTEQRLARLLFKVAVELGKLSHILAAANEIEDETLFKLHAMCVEEVRRINGIIDAEDAVGYQKG